MKHVYKPTIRDPLNPTEVDELFDHLNQEKSLAPLDFNSSNPHRDNLSKLMVSNPSAVDPDLKKSTQPKQCVS